MVDHCCAEAQHLTPLLAARKKPAMLLGLCTKRLFPPEALRREEGPAATTHRKLSVPPVTCPLEGGPIYI